MQQKRNLKGKFHHQLINRCPASGSYRNPRGAWDQPSGGKRPPAQPGGGDERKSTHSTLTVPGFSITGKRNFLLPGIPSFFHSASLKKQVDMTLFISANGSSFQLQGAGHPFSTPEGSIIPRQGADFPSSYVRILNTHRKNSAAIEGLTMMDRIPVPTAMQENREDHL